MNKITKELRGILKTLAGNAGKPPRLVVNGEPFLVAPMDMAHSAQHLLASEPVVYACDTTHSCSCHLNCACNAPMDPEDAYAMIA